MRRLNDLRALGDAWAGKIKSETAIAAYAPERALRPRGDRPLCACGKVIYPTRKEALRAAAELGALVSAYLCPFGAYHLRAKGRSTRQGGRR